MNKRARINQAPPSITNGMKIACIGEFSWQEEEKYYDECGDLHERVCTRVVPWDLCKKIFKQMQTMDNAMDEYAALVPEDLAQGCGYKD